MNNDLISREDLKEFINSTIASATKVGIVADADYLWELLNYAIDDAPTAEQPKGEWIPVSERLPEKIGTYLVTLEYKEHGKGVTTLWYHGNEIGWDLRVADVVTAWQPLPEPYKEANNEMS